MLTPRRLTTPSRLTANSATAQNPFPPIFAFTFSPRLGVVRPDVRLRRLTTPSRLTAKNTPQKQLPAIFASHLNNAAAMSELALKLIRENIEKHRRGEDVHVLRED